jgi:phosphopantetheine adenylyltransferase
MIEREYSLVVERLESRSHETCFFAFADTVAAKGYKTKRDCHGWMAIKFQHSPGASPGQIVLHVRMRDKTNHEQQAALGILGINLIFGAFYLHDTPEKLIDSLVDIVGNERIEIDMILFSGAAFKDVDNRLMALQLVKSGLTRSVLFTPQGDPTHASDEFYKKNILLLRGSFRPVTKVHQDMIRCGKELFMKDAEVHENNLLVLAEITMSKLVNDGNFKSEDFLGRVDTLCRLGYTVQITDFLRYFKLKEYLAQFTWKKIAILVGVRKVVDIFAEHFYEGMKGGIMEALGILFSRDTPLYVYPRKTKSGEFISLDELFVDDEVKYLFRHFLHIQKLIPLLNYDKKILSIDTSSIRKEIMNSPDSWKNKVPPEVFDEISRRRLFDYNRQNYGQDI